MKDNSFDFDMNLNLDSEAIINYDSIKEINEADLSEPTIQPKRPNSCMLSSNRYDEHRNNHNPNNDQIVNSTVKTKLSYFDDELDNFKLNKNNTEDKVLQSYDDNKMELEDYTSYYRGDFSNPINKNLDPVFKSISNIPNPIEEKLTEYDHIDTIDFKLETLKPQKTSSSMLRIDKPDNSNLNKQLHRISQESPHLSDSGDLEVELLNDSKKITEFQKSINNFNQYSNKNIKNNECVENPKKGKDGDRNLLDYFNKNFLNNKEGREMLEEILDHSFKESETSSKQPYKKTKAINKNLNISKKRINTNSFTTAGNDCNEEEILKVNNANAENTKSNTSKKEDTSVTYHKSKSENEKDRDNETAQPSSANFQNEIQIFTSRLAEKDEMIKSLQSKLNDKEIELRKAEDELTSTKYNLRMYENERKSAKADLELKCIQHDKIQEKLFKLEFENEELRESLEKAKLYQSHYEEMKYKLAELKLDHEQALLNLQNITEENLNLKREIRLNEKELDNKQEYIDLLKEIKDDRTMKSNKSNFNRELSQNLTTTNSGQNIFRKLSNKSPSALRMSSMTGISSNEFTYSSNVSLEKNYRYMNIPSGKYMRTKSSGNIDFKKNPNEVSSNIIPKTSKNKSIEVDGDISVLPSQKVHIQNESMILEQENILYSLQRERNYVIFLI